MCTLKGGEQLNIEIRSKQDATITGYVNVVGRESRTLRDLQGSFVEIVAPNTFKNAIAENPNVGLMFNHKRNVEHRNMKLEEDNIGLKIAVDITDSEVIEKAEHGELRGFSFGMIVKECDWEERNEMRYRTLKDIQLDEISILSCTPAYYGTSIECRGEDEVLKEQRSEDCEFTVEVRSENDDEEQQKAQALEQLNTQRKRFEFELLRGK